jgi:superfamily II DNA or RNA helicase
MVGTLKDKKFIAVENYDALDPDKILEGYHGVIIDEFHHSGADTIRKLSLRAWKNVYYRYGLTATPIRANSEEQILLESVIAPIVYKLEYQTAVDKGYIVPVTAYFYQLPRIKCAAKNWKEVYSELVVNRKDRNKKIVNIIESLHDTGESVLVLVNEISHGKELQKLCEARGLNIPFANGQDDNSRIMILEFNLKETHILIGSSILGEGVDTKPCGWVIMAGGTGKSKVQIMQRIGRAIRNYPGKISGKILTFLDPSHKYLTNHHREYVKVLKQEYGIEPCKLGD